MLNFIVGGANQDDNHKKTDVGSGSCGAVLMLDYIDLQALPEGCIANIVSLTTPRDACRLSCVSRSFRSASESDAVWDRFLSHEVNGILASQFLNPPISVSTKKQLYLTLCNPVLIEQGKMSFSLDKWSGKKIYMIAARELSIVWADTPHYWKWISLPGSRFEEVAELVSVCWLEIRGKIDIRMLSPSTLYKAYLVFKSTVGAYGFGRQPVEVTVGMLGGGHPSKHTVYLDADRGQNSNMGYHLGPGPRRVGMFNRRHIYSLQDHQPGPINDAEYPKGRDDGWLEIELGEFFCQGGEDGELEMTCLEVRGGDWKGGLIVQGIEIRPKGKD